MRTSLIKTIVFILFMILVVSNANTLYAGYPIKKGPVRILSKAAVQSFFLFEANRIGTWTTNVGEIVSFRKTGNPGMEWPINSGKTINFQSGLWIGGMVGTQIRTAAAEYAVEFVPGTFEDWRNQDDPKYRVYTITRKDFVDPGVDFIEWPFEDGAPMLLDDDGMPILNEESGNPIPGLIGDQLSWSVFNDADPVAHVNPFNTPPLGVEVQQTLWAFDRADAFGDMIFMKYLIINKGNNLIDDVYLSFWADIDLGFVTDDLIGSDTLLSLGYNYNDGPDPIYGASPPAIGYDFFQGPIVVSPGDTAKVSRNFRSSGKVPGFKNLPMTSLSHYENGGPEGTGDPNTAQEMYWFQQGLDGLGGVKVDPTTGLVTPYSYPGDPVTGEGWLRTDAKDMRFMLTTGPFTLAVGDTQEMVGGMIVAQGTSALNSITKLKVNDVSAQIAYDIDFALAGAPPAPEVTTGSFPGEIVITWEPNSESYHEEDKVVPHPVTLQATFYDFQGYNIYQVNDPVVSPGQVFKLLATFDVKDTVGDIKDFVTIGADKVILTVQKANNSGIQRFLKVTKDEFTGKSLINYRKYYFMVEAYGYNGFGTPKILSSGKIFEVVPGAPAAGTTLAYEPDFLLTDYKRMGTSPNKGIADVNLNAKILNPHQTKNKTFEITFFTDSLNTDYWWRMEDISLNSIIIDSQATNKTEEGEVVDAISIDPAQIEIIDGMRISLEGTYRVAIDTAGGDLTKQTANKDITTILNFVGTSTNSENVVGGKPTALLADFFRGLGGDNPLLFRHDVELRITEGGSKASMYSSAIVDMVINKDNPQLVDVPFQLWDVEYNNGDDTFGRQINAIFVDDQAENDSTNGFLGSLNDDRDIIIPVYSAYDAQIHTSEDSLAAWMFFFGQSDSIGIGLTIDSVNIEAGYSVGDTFYFKIVNHIVPEEDVLRFTTVAPNNNDTDARDEEFSKINVFPNPYFGQNIEEISPFNRFITFTHLPPDNVTIRIFTIAGHLVKSIKHDNMTSMEKWDLVNTTGIPVASGMYIAYIEVENGPSKILKLAVFIPEERLDLF